MYSSGVRPLLLSYTEDGCVYYVVCWQSTQEGVYSLFKCVLGVFHDCFLYEQKSQLVLFTTTIKSSASGIYMYHNNKI